MLRATTPSRPRVLLPALAALAALAAACSDSGTGPKRATIAAAPKAYLDSALTFEHDVFYWVNKVNWTQQHDAVFAKAGAAQTIADSVWGAVEYSIEPWLRDAGDQHSAFWRPSEAPGAVDSPPDTLNRYIVQGKTLASGSANIAYLYVPTYSGKNDTGRADSTQTMIRTLDQSAPCGWVLDLRLNPGGTWAAMVAGINPLMANANFAGFVDRDNARYLLYVKDGVAGTFDPSSGRYYPQVQASSNYALKRPNSPVAVLIGPYTASAGELITLGLRGGPAPVRTFGANTYGVTTVPFYHDMPDGGYLNITGAIMFDRTGQLYGGAITPDQPVTGPAPRAILPGQEDAVVTAAKSWLAAQPACTGATASRGPATSRAVNEAALPGVVRGGGHPERVSPHFAAPALLRALGATR